MARLWGLLLYWSLYTLGDSLVRGGVTQTPSFISAEVGDRVHLTCLYSQNVGSGVLWMRQPVGEQPVSMASHYSSITTYYNGFDKSARFQLEKGTSSFNLTISQTQTNDSATYYCGSMFYGDVTFGEGTVVLIRGDSSSHVLVEQQDSVSVRLGGEVTLTCSVHSWGCGCAEEPRVFWFRPAAGPTHPGVLFTRVNSSGSGKCVCEQCPEDAASPHTHSCVYQLPRTNLSHSDAHTHYCAVVACGRMLFGNGTRVRVEDEPPQPITWHLAVSSLATALLMSLLVNVTFCLRVHKSRSASQSGVSGVGPTCKPFLPVSKGSSESRGQDGVSYATVQIRAGQRHTQHTLYSPVRCTPE